MKPNVKSLRKIVVFAFPMKYPSSWSAAMSSTGSASSPGLGISKSVPSVAQMS